MRLREVLQENEIVIAPGAYDAVSAQIIEKAGFPVAYITGLGNEASDIGYPDLGLTTSTEIVRRAWNITQRLRVPVICDADTGFGGALNLYRTIGLFESVGVSGIHIEDQTSPKRCGVLAGKQVIPAEDFAKKIKAATDARKSEDFVIIARTDAKSTLGIDEVIRRLNLYAENGADLGMLGDFYSLEEYKRIVKKVSVPIVALASCHDYYSLQPDISVDDWKAVGVKMVFYWHLPLFAAMKAVTHVVRQLRESGTTYQMKDDVFAYSEYEEVMKLSKWLDIDQKFG